MKVYTFFLINQMINKMSTDQDYMEFLNRVDEVEKEVKALVNGDVTDLEAWDKEQDKKEGARKKKEDKK